MEKEIKTPCLIIGSGIAGLSSALALADKGVESLVISCASQMIETNTSWAQGGIIHLEDTSQREGLAQDIFEAGAGINYPPAVEQLVKMGPELVKKILIKLADIPFDKNSGGSFHLTQEGGHSEPRILHRGDQSGLSIEKGLLQLCEASPKIKFLSHTTAVNLLMTSYHCKDKNLRYQPARCFGAFVFDQKTEKVYPILAHHTILATGGLGQIFLHSTNSAFARGDGIALAFRAGARLQNLEFIQFHPTTFYHPRGRRFLISEALRGEGAVLINKSGERFLSKYLPQLKIPELAPRDKVAKHIHEEMLSTGSSCVFLDISHKPADWIKERFPFVYKACAEYDIDITKEPIPVVPGAHYMCGGVWTGLEGNTSIPHLWAAGETACTGLHGANRLASTSLLEGLVWGTRAGETIAGVVSSSPEFPEVDEWKSETLEVDSSFLGQDWLTLKNTMWNYVGLIKTESRLSRAEGILSELNRGIETFYRNAKLSDELIGLRNASLTAWLVLEACKRNRKSLGCYLREDRPI